MVGPQKYALAVATLEQLGLELPVIAVGGITETAVAPLMKTGIYGIAVSNAITSAPDMEVAYTDFYKLVAVVS